MGQKANERTKLLERVKGKISQGKKEDIQGRKKERKRNFYLRGGRWKKSGKYVKGTESW